MICLLRFKLLALLFCFLASGVYAQTADLESERAKLADAFSNMMKNEGFSCQFRQIIYFSEGGEQYYSGELAIRRPGNFRWQYHLPYEQLYISSGTVIWHYEPDLMQAERMKNLDAVDPVAMKLLDGRIGIKDIRLLATEKLESGNISYRIQVKNGPELLVAFTSSGRLHWLESKDMLGNRNRMILLDVNKKVPAKSFFRFTPPKGVDVIDVLDDR